MNNYFDKCVGRWGGVERDIDKEYRNINEYGGQQFRVKVYFKINRCKNNC